MKDEVLDNFDVKFISAFESLIEIVLETGCNSKSLVFSVKDEWVEKLLGLARQLDLNLSSQEILVIYEKLKFRFKDNEPITFTETDEDMPWDATGPWWLYVRKQGESNNNGER